MSKKRCNKCGKGRKLKNGLCSKCRVKVIIAVECPECGGTGVGGVEPVHGCGGDPERCAYMCPEPSPLPCECCGGSGTVEVKSDDVCS